MSISSSRSSVNGVFVEPIALPRTFEHAVEHIVEGIERARLRNGDRLPTEAEIATQLQVSQPTVRQALRVLQSAGLVDVRRGYTGGLFVAADVVPVELIGDLVGLEEDYVAEVLRARRVIETGATELAMRFATDEDYAEVDRAVSLMEARLGQPRLMAEADAAFHRTIVRASHNRPIQSAMRAIGRDLAPIRDAYPAGGADDMLVLDIHRRQVDAMRRRKPRVLAAVLDEHFRMLEEAYAAAVGLSRPELYGEADPHKRAHSPATGSEASRTPLGRTRSGR